jgi:adenylate kinase
MRLRIHFKTMKTTISKLLKIPKRLETRLQNDSSVRRPLATSPSLLRSISVNRYSSVTFALISTAKMEASIII